MLILPFIIIFLGVLTFISYNNASSELNDSIDNRMASKLNETVEIVDKKLTTHERNLVTTKALVESRANDLTRDQYRAYFEQLLPSNEETYGLGVWYEPYTYNENEEYFGPYVYKDGDSILYTEDYEDPSYNYHEIDWYKQGLQSETPVWTAPYYDETLDQTFITTGVAFSNQNGTTEGVITSDYVLNSIQTLISDIQVEKTGYAVLIDENGGYLAHPNTEWLLSADISNQIKETKHVENLLSTANGTIHSEANDKEYEVYYQTLPKVGWKVLLFAPSEELYASLPSLLSKLIITSVILIALIIVIVYFIGNTISRDAKQMNAHLETLASGDLTHRIDVQSKDEFGQMGRYFNSSIHSLQTMLATISQSTENVASTSEQLSASSQEINSSIEEVASSIQDVASNAENQNRLAVDLSTSSEGMQGKMKQMANFVQSIEKKASQSTKLADKGSNTIEEVIKKMTDLNQHVKDSSSVIHSLNKKSDQIEQMANLITDVTEQTNLLALNAAIEAARAGEAGKGFAVVAEEVRKLAEQSGKASQEINNTISGIQQEVSQSVIMMDNSQTIAGEGIHSVEEAGKSFDAITSSIFDLSSKVTDLTTEMNHVLGEMNTINDLSSQVNNDSTNTSDLANNVSAATEEQVSMMTEIAKAAESLAELAQQLQEEITNFKVDK